MVTILSSPPAARNPALRPPLCSCRALVFSRGHSAENKSVSICLRPDGLGRLALLGCINRWLVFVFLLTLVFAATTRAQDDSFDPTESYRATDDDGNTTRITPSALGGFNATDSEGNVTRIRPSALGGYKAIDSEGNTTRIKPMGFGSRSSYDRAPVDAGDYESDDSSSYAHSRHSSSDTRRSDSDEDDGFAAASGKCGDVTTQKIGNFFYHSDGTVTQKVGNFFYGSDGQVTQKVGNSYHHSDGTTTQRIGSFYYDSDGGVTQKIGSFYYHSGGKPCEDEEAE